MENKVRMAMQETNQNILRIKHLKMDKAKVPDICKYCGENISILHFLGWTMEDHIEFSDCKITANRDKLINNILELDE